MHNALKKAFFFIALLVVANAIYANKAASIAYKFYLKGDHYEKSLYAFEARDAFLKARQWDPQNSGYLTRYTWFLDLYGFREQAIVAFREALKQPQAQKTNLYKSLAWDEFYLGSLESSLQDFKQVYFSPWLRSNYTNAFKEAPLLANAESRSKIKELKSQLINDPNNLALQKELFKNYIYNNEFSKAIRLGSILITHKELDNFTRLEFARTLFKNKEYEKAALQYHQLMEKFPHNAYLSYEWGNQLVELKQYDKAYEMFKISLSDYASPEGKEALAKISALKGDCKGAFQLLTSIKEKNSLGYLIAKADVHRNCQQFSQAMQYYQTVLEKYPYNSDALWGVLTTTATTHRYAGNRVAYDRWQEVYNWERSFLKKQLVPYYQSPFLPMSVAFYDSSVTFRRHDAGAAYDFYTTANTRLNILDAYSTFAQEGYNTVRRNMVQLQGSKLFTEHVQVFAALSDKDYSNNFNNLNGYTTFQYAWSETLNANITYNHSDIIDTEPPFSIQVYNYILAIGAVGLNIHTDDFSGSMYYQPTQDLSFWGKGIYGKYSDGNNRTQGSFEASYRIEPIPEIRIIYDYFYLNYSNPAPIFTQNNNSQSAYYDPINFQVHTGRVRFEHVLTSKLRFRIEDGLSYFPQNSSIGNAIAGYLDYTFITNLEMTLAAQYYRQNESVYRYNHHGDAFWARGVNLSLIYKV